MQDGRNLSYQFSMTSGQENLRVLVSSTLNKKKRIYSFVLHHLKFTTQGRVSSKRQRMILLKKIWKSGFINGMLERVWVLILLFSQ